MDLEDKSGKVWALQHIQGLMVQLRNPVELINEIDEKQKVKNKKTRNEIVQKNLTGISSQF